MERRPRWTADGGPDGGAGGRRPGGGGGGAGRCRGGGGVRRVEPGAGRTGGPDRHRADRGGHRHGSDAGAGRGVPRAPLAHDRRRLGGRCGDAGLRPHGPAGGRRPARRRRAVGAGDGVLAVLAGHRSRHAGGHGGDPRGPLRPGEGGRGGGHRPARRGGDPASRPQGRAARAPARWPVGRHGRRRRVRSGGPADLRMARLGAAGAARRLRRDVPCHRAAVGAVAGPGLPGRVRAAGAVARRRDRAPRRARHRLGGAAGRRRRRADLSRRLRGPSPGPRPDGRRHGARRGPGLPGRRRHRQRLGGRSRVRPGPPAGVPPLPCAGGGRVDARGMGGGAVPRRAAGRAIRRHRRESGRGCGCTGRPATA